MLSLRTGVSQLTLMAVVSSLMAPGHAFAADFTVNPGVTDNTSKTVTNNDVGTIAATGSLVVATAIVWTGGSATPGVTINNSGTITGSTRAIDTSGNFSTGSITVNNAAGAIITGTINDAWRINASNLATSTITLNNSGTIVSNGGQALDWAAIVLSTPNIRITNNSTGTIRSTVNDAIRPGSGNIQITNSGLIESTASSDRAINIEHGGSIANITQFSVTNNAGAILQSGDDTIRITAATIDAPSGSFVIDNAGIIRSTNDGQAIDFENLRQASSITIINRATGLIQASGADAIKPGNGANVTNFGQIIANATSGTVFDAVTNRPSGNDGIDFGAASGTVTNKTGGLISGFRHGITNGTGNSVTVVNEVGATIIGRNGSGFGSDGNGTVINFGLISGDNTDGGTTRNVDGDGVDIDGIGNVTNFGTVRGTGASGVDTGGQTNNSEGIALGGGTILNAAGALISGANHGILVDNGSGGSAVGATTITNAGTIQGLNGFGIKFVGNFNDTITNTGTITGTNGLAIDMGAGDDTLNLGTGSTISGLIDGGAGTDTINLTGNGSLTNTANFEALTVQSGTWTATGTQTFANGTTVSSGGTLLVNGTLNGPMTVLSSGVLGGTGTVGGNTAVNGGTLSPGNSVGTLTIQGNLAFTAAATYLVDVSSTGADRTNASGTATLGGARVTALFQGDFVSNRRQTILNATGGVSGTFGSVTSNIASIVPTLGYDANNVFLNVALDFAAAAGAGGLNRNQAAVAQGLTNAFNANGGIPLTFAALTPAGLTQVAGEAATGTQQTTFGAMDQFINMTSDPFMGTRAGSATTPAQAGYADDDESLAYAAKRKRTAAEREAYAAFTKAPPRASFDQRWSVWGAGYGGTQKNDGDAATGSQDITSRIAGGAAGFDYRLDPATLIGFSLGGAGTKYDLAGGFGGGRSEMFQAGVYGRHAMGPGYVAAALAYGWQDITTDRTVFGSSLRANFNTNALSGRLEGGWRFAYGMSGLTPYAAGQFTSLWLPAYAEQVTAGVNTFALSYADKNVTASRTELGLRADSSFIAAAVVTLRGRAAWAHNFSTDRSVAAIFQTLPVSTFVVNGAAQARNAALVSAGAEAKWLNGISVGASFEGEFSNATRSYAGKGIVRYQW